MVPLPWAARAVQRRYFCGCQLWLWLRGGGPIDRVHCGALNISCFDPPIAITLQRECNRERLAQWNDSSKELRSLSFKPHHSHYLTRWPPASAQMESINYQWGLMHCCERRNLSLPGSSSCMGLWFGSWLQSWGQGNSTFYFCTVFPSKPLLSKAVV